MLEQYKATGSIYKIYPLKSYGERFRTREFVLLIPEGDYQQYVKFQLKNLKCDLLEHFQEEDEITVHFNLEGRPFTKNGVEEVYSHLSVWQIENARPQKAALPGFNDKFDNLPF